MATTISRLEVELILDSSDFEMKISGSKAALASFTGVIGKADRGARRHEKTIRGLGTSFRHTVVTLGLLKDAIRTAWNATGGLVQGIVDVNAEFERLNILLKGMSQGVTEVERLADAVEQFNQVIDLAKNAPFTVKELTSSWVKFKSVGVDPATGSLNALTDAVARFGGTNDILHRATIAVQQMAGKGVISMEELRQQMGEAVPKAMVLLARGMNMSVGDMVRAISKGAVIAKPALQKMFAEFDLTFGGASQELMKTYIGSLARLTTVWQLTLKELGGASGLFEAVKEEVKRLIIELDDPAVRRFGIDIAVGMVKGFQALVLVVRESVAWLTKHADTIWKVIGAWAAFKAMGIIKMLISTNSVLRALFKTISLGIAALSGFIFTTRRSTAATRLLAKSQVGLGGTMKGLLRLTPGLIGIIISLAAAFWGWFAASEAVNESVRSGLEDLELYASAAEQSSIDLARAEAKVNSDRLKQQKDYFAALGEALKASVETGQKSVEKQIRDALKIEEGLIVIQQALVDGQAAIIDNAINGAARRAASTAKREMLRIFRDALEQVRNLVRSADTDIDTLFEKGTIDEKERLVRRLKNWKRFQDAQKALFVKQIADQVKVVLDAEKARNSAITKADKDRWEEARLQAAKTLQQIGQIATAEMTRIANDLAHIAAPTVLMGAAEKAIALASAALDRFLGNSQGKLAGLNAELFDGLKETEKFLAKVFSGKIFADMAKWKQEMFDVFAQIVPLLVEIDRVSDEVKRKKSFESAMKAAAKSLAATREEAIIFNEAVLAGLDKVPNSVIRRLRRMMAAYVDTFGAATEEGKKLLAVQKELLKAAQDVNANKRILDARKEINELDVLAIQNARERFNAEQVLFDLQWQAFLLENAQADNIRELTELYELLRTRKAEAFEDNTPIKRMLKEWEDVQGNLEKATANWMSGFVDTIVDGLAEGKFAFKDFAIAILKDLTRILIRAILVRAVMAAFGGSAPIDPNAGVSSGEFTGTGGFFAKGGIMTSNGMMKRYARGGIATKPQVAIFGEGAQNEAFVPLPDGRSIPVSLGNTSRSEPPDITVNVINESGIPLDAEQQGDLVFDGEQYIMDVVLKNANTAGRFRDGMRSINQS